jgi:hypothetical protein
LFLNFVSSFLPCCSPFFGFYLSVLYYLFLVCISLHISSILSLFPFLFLFRLFLSFDVEVYLSLSSFVFSPSYLMSCFLISLYTPISLHVLPSCTFFLFLLQSTLQNHTHSFVSPDMLHVSVRWIKFRSSNQPHSEIPSRRLY